MITEHEDNECTTYHIDLDGEQGNAFYLLGIAQKILQEQGNDARYIEDVMVDLQSGDYENLIKVFESHFRNHVTLVTSDPNILALSE